MGGAKGEEKPGGADDWCYQFGNKVRFPHFRAGFWAAFRGSASPRRRGWGSGQGKSSGVPWAWHSGIIPFGLFSNPRARFRELPLRSRLILPTLI